MAIMVVVISLLVGMWEMNEKVKLGKALCKEKYDSNYKYSGWGKLHCINSGFEREGYELEITNRNYTGEVK